MNESPRRREVLYGTALAALYGCMEPRSRSLRFGSIETSRKPDVVELHVAVQASSKNAEGDWATFHDVEVVGYRNPETELCRATVGTLAPSETATVTLDCTSVPPYLTCVAEESPCDNNTWIAVLEHQPSQGGDGYSPTDPRQCDEKPLPTRG
jgi:hypothetical protein